MTNINVFLRDNLLAIAEKNLSIAPQIEEKKLNNAIKSFNYSGSSSNVVALYDTTMLGSGKDGLLFTGKQVIYRAAFSDPISIDFDSILNVECVETLMGSKLEHSIEVTRKDKPSVILKNLGGCNYKKLAEILQKTSQDFEDYKEEKQLVPIDEMSEALKEAYIKAIISMAYDNDNHIDDKEFAEILLLMTRLVLSPESRLHLRTYMASTDQLTTLETLVEIIDKECPDGQIKSVHISLVKDMINIYFCTDSTDISKFVFLQKHRHLLNVTDKEIDLIKDTITNDHNMLKEDYSDDQIISALKELSAKAAAVGTPLAAVYLSGSVVGMSAAGLTSGLATMGLGGMLGLSSMASGIGVAVLLGVGAYTGMRKLTGADELTRSKRRELMLNEVIKQTQATISLLIQDVNFVIVKLNECILTHGTQDVRIKQLTALLTQMTSAGTVLTQKSDVAQGSATKLQCAQFLDENKLKALTKEPTKQELEGVIRGFYELRTFKEVKEGQSPQQVNKLALRRELTVAQYESLAKAFEAIGYFNVSDVLKSTAVDAASKAKDKLAGFFS
ncbi:hypothetical protein C8N29_11914 [Agitococcus lubricus]|uniref:Uncharacterized protein n=2 Tax=Agitococcus lubricus TaxID=1077255 RepID=A0A2T5IU10_9GAMM|nr:hypothetical protein C8N29_11914 [Agitococcus lubricus]